ncbi:hypothetical protein [Ramlibacter sp.]|uniref:hypothetical protein n=1 Tax=Ramlibacter sp. TaxID=1917967 RepID=UPI003D144541
MAIAFIAFLRNLFGFGATPPVVQRMQVAAPRSVRVVHKGPGRMVISGRLADVCAELDRLAALEASQPAFAPTR